MESQPQNPEFRNNPENFHLCVHKNYTYTSMSKPVHDSEPAQTLSLISHKISLV